MATAIDALPRLYSSCDLATFGHQTLAILHDVVRSDVNAYNEVNPRLKRAIGVVDDPLFPMEKFVGALEAYMHEHPVIRYCQETKDGSAHKISDFISRAQLHGTGLYNELYRPTGVEYQIAITILTREDEFVSLVVNRNSGDFDEDDRAVLNFLRPHIAQAYLSAIATTRLKEQLRRANAALEKVEQGILTLTSKLKVDYASPRAAEILSAFYGPREKGAPLPSSLHQWVRESLWRLDCPDEPQRPPEPLRVFGERGWMMARLLGRAIDGKTTVVLEEQASAGTASNKLRPLGLTAREAETLYWVTQGKTNAQIGIICGLSARTVQKHLEHVFSKLGVETRTAAALRASELL
jgi:DNA-binding CsgD family transcriptional regulator